MRGREHQVGGEVWFGRAFDGAAVGSLAAALVALGAGAVAGAAVQLVWKGTTP